MGLDVALDELYATGWSLLDTAGCRYHADGRTYPSMRRVHEEFGAAGLKLSVSRIDRFDCWRAEWADTAGQMAGSVVGAGEAEAAVFALAQMRRQMAAAVV